MKTALLLLFSLIVSYASADGIALVCPNYADKNAVMDLSSVKIADCTAVPCNFIKGKNASVSFNFKANGDMDTLTVSLYGRIAGIWVELPGGLPNDNICSLGVTCPMKAGTTYTSNIQIFVDPKFPSLTTLVEVRLSDSSKNVQGCFESEVKITS